MPDKVSEARGREVCLLGVGAFTPVGPTAPTSAAAARAAIAGFAAHPTAKDQAGEPVVVARFPEIDDLESSQRFLNSATIAAGEALAPFLKLERELRGPLYLGIGLPEGRPGRPAALDETVADTVAALVRESAPRHAVKTFAAGHAAGLVALKEAAEAIRSGKAELALVGGVDSYQEAETLAWLESNEQVNGSGGDGNRNPWGFVPGEAAAFLLLGSSETAESLGLPVYGEVLAVGSSVEPHKIKTDDVCIGEGLTKAMREALAPFRDRLDRPRVSAIYCDMNGEPYRGMEYAYAITRHSKFFVDPSQFRAPADCWGDVGAASGPLGCVLAWAAGVRGYAEGPYSLIWASSEGGRRAAALLRMNISKRENA